MRAYLLVRSLTDAERRALEAGLRSSQACALRRAQMLVASVHGERVPSVARTLGGDAQTVRNALHAFEATGVAALTPGSSRPQTMRPAFNAATAARLTDLRHRSPRDLGHPTRPWTLDSAARTAYAEGLTPRGARRHPPAADQEPLAQPDRAEAGPRQTARRRAGTAADGRRTRNARLRDPGRRPCGPPHHAQASRLGMHEQAAT
jgi:hypothetical protein